MFVQVLGVKIDTITKNEAVERARVFFNDGAQHSIFTPNPEMVVKAQSDSYFKEVLNSSSLSLCDGFGLWLGAKIKMKKEKIKIERITGVDFMLELCALAQAENKSIFLLGSGSVEVIQKTQEELGKKFPSLKIGGINKGPQIVELGIKNQESGFLNSKFIIPNSNIFVDVNENNEIIDVINKAHPELLFVAFGMGKQEKWIYENLPKLPSVKIAMGVGGSFDYISATIPRAPLLMRKIGLEWLYRLVKQPARFKRILNATVKFTYLVFKSR